MDGIGPPGRVRVIPLHALETAGGDNFAYRVQHPWDAVWRERIPLYRTAEQETEAHGGTFLEYTVVPSYCCSSSTGGTVSQDFALNAVQQYTSNLRRSPSAALYLQYARWRSVYYSMRRTGKAKQSAKLPPHKLGMMAGSSSTIEISRGRDCLSGGRFLSCFSS